MDLESSYSLISWYFHHIAPPKPRLSEGIVEEVSGCHILEPEGLKGGNSAEAHGWPWQGRHVYQVVPLNHNDGPISASHTPPDRRVPLLTRRARRLSALGPLHNPSELSLTFSTLWFCYSFVTMVARRRGRRCPLIRLAASGTAFPTGWTLVILSLTLRQKQLLLLFDVLGENWWGHRWGSDEVFHLHCKKPNPSAIKYLESRQRMLVFCLVSGRFLCSSISLASSFFCP